MDEITTSISELINSFTPMIQKLSELFGVSVDAIKEHGMEYVMAYGRYHVVNKTLHNVALISLLTALLVVTIELLIYFEIEDFEPTLSKKLFILCGIGIVLLVAIVVALLNVVPYLASPEIYSIQAVLDLVKGG